MKIIRYFLILLAFGSQNIARAQTTEISGVLNAYLEIKNALVADDSKAANTAGLIFVKRLKQTDVSKLTAPQKAIWLKYAEKLRYNGEHIGESNMIAHQREHFGALSADMIPVVKAFKPGKAVLYSQYCPMAKQYWISDNAVIKNPYYGKKMIECGVTKEKL